MITNSILTLSIVLFVGISLLINKVVGGESRTLQYIPIRFEQDEGERQSEVRRNISS